MVVQNSVPTPGGRGDNWFDMDYVGVGVSVPNDFGKLIRISNHGSNGVDIPMSADDAMTAFSPYLYIYILPFFSIRV